MHLPVLGFEPAFPTFLSDPPSCQSRSGPAEAEKPQQQTKQTTKEARQTHANTTGSESFLIQLNAGMGTKAEDP